MKCNRCGEPLLTEDRFCTNCGTPIPTQPQMQTVQVNPNNMNNALADDNKKANTLCIISILCYMVIPVIVGALTIFLSALTNDSSFTSLLSMISAPSRIAAFVLVIIARAKYPNNKFAKILMWVYISLIIAAFVLVIILVLLILFGVFYSKSLF